jgi:hypothetical protein
MIKKDFKPNFSPLNLRPNHTPHTLTTSAIAETGCRGHYLMMTSLCSNAKPTKNGASGLLPNGGTMQAIHAAELPIKALPYAVRQAHLFPALSSGALLSIGQLCDHGCPAIFNASAVNIIKNYKTILQGQRNPTNGMWVIQLPADNGDAPPTQAPSPNKLIACSAIDQTTNAALATPAPKQAIAGSANKHKTKTNLVAFLSCRLLQAVLPHRPSSAPSKLSFLLHGLDSLPNSLPNTYPSPSHSLKVISVSNTKMYAPPSQPRPNLLLNLLLNAWTNESTSALPTSSNPLAKSIRTYLDASQFNLIEATNTLLSSTTMAALP